MIFKKKNNNENLPALMREVGYRPIGATPEGELNCVRPLAGNYPRFHIYAESNEHTITFKLHLDQKKPSYGGETAHSVAPAENLRASASAALARSAERSASISSTSCSVAVMTALQFQPSRGRLLPGRARGHRRSLVPRCG